jgi:glycosyltransferase involved in cell wall biosynthesis
MASGIPVVAFDDGGNPELVVNGQTGVLVPSGDVAGFASSLAVLLDDDIERQKMGQQARRRVEALFDTRRNAEETQALYRELLCV